MIDPRLPDKNKKDDNDWEDEAYKNNSGEAMEDEVIEEIEEEKEDESESE